MKQKILYALVISAGLLLSSCGDLQGNSQESLTPGTSVPASDRSSIETPTSDSVDESIERKIVLRDNATTFTGSGISVQDNTVIIYKPGTYNISGTV